jgi:YesN/AraC family two-component response regulator
MCDIKIAPESFNPRVLYVIVSTSKGKEFREHFNHDNLEMKYILEGSCTYLIDDRRYEVKEGDIIFCNPNIVHKKFFKGTESITELNIGVNNFKLKGLKKGYILDEKESPLIKFKKYLNEYKKILNEIICLKENFELGNDLILKTSIMRLIIYYLKEINRDSKINEDTKLNFDSYNRSTIVKTLKNFLNKNYMKNVSLDQMSNKFYLNRVYISKIFKEETGEAPINYLIKVRLSNAVQFLDNENFSIKNVSEMVGFSDENYFSKLFKKYYSLSPEDYRKTIIKRDEIIEDEAEANNEETIDD